MIHKYKNLHHPFLTKPEPFSRKKILIYECENSKSHKVITYHSTTNLIYLLLYINKFFVKLLNSQCIKILILKYHKLYYLQTYIKSLKFYYSKKYSRIKFIQIYQPPVDLMIYLYLATGLTFWWKIRHQYQRSYH